MLSTTSASATGGAQPAPPPAAAGPDPDLVAAVTLSCPDVAALSGGSPGEVATYLPGRRVVGVRIGDEAVEVHVVGRYGPTMDEIGSQVRAALTPIAGARTVAVTVEDLTLAPDPPPAARRSRLDDHRPIRR
jgi:hypothetical protein